MLLDVKRLGEELLFNMCVKPFCPLNIINLSKNDPKYEDTSEHVSQKNNENYATAEKEYLWMQAKKLSKRKLAEIEEFSTNEEYSTPYSELLINTDDNEDKNDILNASDQTPKANN